MRIRQAYQPSAELYTNYFKNQNGYGLPYFAGARLQRGHGIGGLFKSLGAALLPVLKSGGKFLGKQLLSTGAKVASDVLKGRNVGASLRRRGKEGLRQTLTSATRAIKRKGPPNKPIPKRGKRKKYTSDIFH